MSNTVTTFDTSFKQWMHSTYDRTELQDIAQYGCESGTAGGMIYYTETNNLYDLYAEELHDVIYNYEKDTGTMPQYIVDRLGDLTGFKNSVVWFVAEMYAHEMISEDETEEV